MTDQTHPPEWMFHAFLDDELAAEGRREMEDHLAACPECAARLDELEALFITIESQPQTPLSRDLAPAVLHEIRKTPSVSFRLRWIAGLELVATALLLALVPSLLSESLSSLTVGIRPPLGLSLLALQAWLVRAGGWLALGRGALFPWSSTAPERVELWLWALLPMAALWLLANAVLLRTGRRDSRTTK